MNIHINVEWPHLINDYPVTGQTLTVRSYLVCKADTNIGNTSLQSGQV